MKDIATIETTQYILNHYHLNALKKYGQNFIIDPHIIQKIVDSAHIDDSTLVLEIGPGIGALTQGLSRQAKKVICFEIDERLKELHKDIFGNENIQFYYQDILKVDLDEIIAPYKKDYSRIILVANLPYYITSDIIEYVMKHSHLIDQMVVMVQKEVGVKMSQGYKNPLILMLDYLGGIDYLFTVSKNVFLPAPHVDSAVISMHLEKDFNKQLYQLLNDAFHQKRKTIYNNLKHYENILSVLETCHIDQKKRAQELEIQDYINITKYL